MSDITKVPLENLLSIAFTEKISWEITESIQQDLNTVIEKACTEKNKAVLAVTITLLLKKSEHPEQDIRYHQKGMVSGFSGRSLDSKIVTPFLREHNFPYMKSGSGWLTRSLEQAQPYDLAYSGSIKPTNLKTSFLRIVDEVEHGRESPQECLMYILQRLIHWREHHASIDLAKPTGRRIVDIVELLEQHWSTSDSSGVSVLPVLTVYAVYKCLIAEVKRYEGCQLLELMSHTSADSKTGRLGDIDIQSDEGRVIESVEVKHGITITHQMIAQLKEKIASSGLKTFYVLSTQERIPPEELSKITDLLVTIRNHYGCQVIPNGVGATIRYYLRLLKDTDNFIREYVSLLESNPELPFSLKEKWNEIVG